MNQVFVYIGAALAHYGFGQDHPFGPDRQDAFWREAQRLGLDQRVSIAEPVQAVQQEIERFHTHEYVERVKIQSATGEGFLDYGDTPAFPGVYKEGPNKSEFVIRRSLIRFALNENPLSLTLSRLRERG